MAAWLLKTEATAYGFDDLVRDGRTRWNGVTNPLALKNLRAVRLRDAVVVYHTGDEKAVAGLAEVVRTAYADPERDDARHVVIDIAAVRPLARRVTLAELRASPRFADSPLVRQGRLSVVPLTDAQFREIVKLGGAP